MTTQFLLTWLSIFVFLIVFCKYSKQDLININQSLTKKNFYKIEKKILIFSILINILAAITFFQFFILGEKTYDVLFLNENFSLIKSSIFTLLSLFCYLIFDIFLLMNKNKKITI